MSKSDGKHNIAGTCERLAQPVADAMGLTLWDVRFEKEGGSYFLRYYIDKPAGVNIDDCERFSRAVDKLLDEADPIEQSYCLEVSSPGTERALKAPRHFEAFVGRKIALKLYSPRDGRREFAGTLSSFDAGAKTLVLTTDAGETFQFGLSDLSKVWQYAEYNFKGAER